MVWGGGIYNYKKISLKGEKMKKQILAFILAVGFSGAFAEQSGFFIGGGVGVQGMSRQTEMNAIVTSTAENTASGGSASLLLGYKNMSGGSGTRVYLNYDYNSIEVESGSENKQSQYEIVGLNADYLLNFTDNFGLFVGANVGVIKWGKDLWSLSPSEDSEEWKLYAAAQAGLRGIFGESKSHAVELGVKVPFTTTTIEYKSDLLGKLGETKLRQSSNVSVRYTYTF